MKRIILTLTLFLFTLNGFAGEGMWLPFLLQQINETEMRSMGLKITPEDIYSVKEGSLKDAVLIFGGGCTGEVISSQGLVLTNHHCGYGTVNALSSVENDYLTDGFFAKAQNGEIPCPGLSVRFIRNIIPVTDKILDFPASMKEEDKADYIQDRLTVLQEDQESKTNYEVFIRPFFSGNEYYMFLVERFTDVRLVAYPPNGVGKFGGDTDNWAWPRHTGDFGMFRIYADKNNNAADYSPENKPYSPPRHLKVNVGGLQKGDFTMVYGFPGRTSEYLTSDGLNETMNVLDPARIKIREKRLQIMEADMKLSKSNFIKYASKQARVANYYKKWQGELAGLKLNDAVSKKQREEAKFMQWVNQSPERRTKYGRIISDLKAIYESQASDYLQYEYIRECLKASEQIMSASLGIGMLKAMKNGESLDKYPQLLYNQIAGINPETDEKITHALYAMYQDKFGMHEKTNIPQINAVYDASIFRDTSILSNLIHTKDTYKIAKMIQEDPAFETYRFITQENDRIIPMLRKNRGELDALYKNYIQGLREFSSKPLYPDANSTLRLAYGKVEGLDPQDGMSYSYYTTLGGAVRKRNPEVEEFNMPKRLVDLYEGQDFGRYGIDHKGRKDVPVCFLASNHTTGGNSGSPVLNAYGELIGLNFDRIWEGTMSDIYYDINLCRNISVDIRYVLFLVDKFGGATWIVDEMDLVGRHVDSGIIGEAGDIPNKLIKKRKKRRRY